MTPAEHASLPGSWRSWRGWLWVLLLALMPMAGSAEMVSERSEQVAEPVPEPDPEPQLGAPADRLVFGSFRAQTNAVSWAERVSRQLGEPAAVEEVPTGDAVWYRVTSDALSPPRLERLRVLADRNGLPSWTLRAPATARPVADPPVPAAVPALGTGSDGALVTAGEPTAEAGVQSAPSSAAPPPEPLRVSDDPSEGLRLYDRFDLDLGFQSRAFAEEGLDGQSQLQPSFSVQLEYFRSWDQDRQSLTIAPFFRYDARDSERTHGDLREFYWTRIGDTWDLHLGVRRVFWGVTEFSHVVDIINQTDLVENIDGEDKLGQPMAQLSLIRDWGMLDLFLLPGLRERTFPGPDGRLRPALPIDTDSARYQSGAGQDRMSWAVRWSHHVGPVEFGLEHFSGNGRDPLFDLIQGPDGAFMLRPVYTVIDQTGVDAQAIFGDWAWKLEAMSRGGFGDRYAQAAGGFERTLIGALGSRADLGLVVEYLYDERGDDAFDNVFEHDLALGTRWTLNDLADSQALVGVVWDVQTDEYIVKLEASRRLGDTWTLSLEGRVFGGADEPTPPDWLDSIASPDNKTGALQRDDYLQLELSKYL